MGSPFDFTSPTDPVDPTQPQSPFQRTFNPDSQGTLTGMLGRMFGVPNAADQQAALDSAIMGKLTGSLEEAGGSPQKAITNFLQTPEGQQLMSRPGAVDTLTRWTKTITPPDPVNIPTAPGNQNNVYQGGRPVAQINNPTSETQNYREGVPQAINTPAGSRTNVLQKGQPTQAFSTPPTEQQNMEGGVPQFHTTPQASNTTVYKKGSPVAGETVNQPPVETQNFNALSSRLSGATPDVLDALIINTLNPNDVQQKGLRLINLVKNKFITQEEADKFGAGVYSVIQGTNDLGEPNGTWMFIDNVKGKARVISPGSNGADPMAPNGGTAIPSTSGTPTVIPKAAFNPDGSVDPVHLTDKKYMGFGLGPLPGALSFGGYLVRTINPSNNEQTSQAASIRRNQIDQLEQAVASVGAAQGGKLKVQAQQWLDLVPGKNTSDPRDGYNKLIQLHDRVVGLIASENQTYRDTRLPNSVRKEAQDNIQRMQNVISAMPSREESLEMQKLLSTGKSPAVTPISAVRSAVDMGKNAVETGKNVIQDLRQNGVNPPNLKQDLPNQNPLPGPRAQPTQQPGQPTAQQPQPQQPAIKIDPAKIPTMGLPDIQALGDPASLPPEMRPLILDRLKALKAASGGGKRSEAPASKTTKLAGDVVDRSQEFKNLQQSNAISRALDRSRQEMKPKAPVVNINVNPFQQRTG